LTEPVTVLLHGGTYRIEEKLAFGPADSGSAEAPVTYRSHPGERAVLSGGRVLEGTWRQTPGKPYWQLEDPAGLRFFSLYADNLSRTRARHPNWSRRVLRAEGQAPGEDPRQAFTYFPGDIDPNWSNPTDIDIVLLCSWTPTIHRIEEIVPANRAVRFHSSHGRTVDFWERNFRYYLSNVLEALDDPGEWYLDYRNGTLYYYPMPGEDPNAIEFVAPVLRSRMVEFTGDLDVGLFVEHLHFQDLEFRHLDGDMDRYNGMYRQGHMFLDAAVVASGLRQASFEGCTFAQLGEYALELADGCRDVRVQRCHFHDLGAGAMQLGVTSLQALQAKGPKTAEVAAADLLVDNNCIHRLGTVWHGCYGIVNRFANRTRITHNEMFDMHWDAIGLDARWNWQGEGGEVYSQGNVVAYNHLHHLGLGYHTDAAGVYQFGPLDTHIHHNLIHDTVAYPYICGYAGIYLDQQSRNALVENNLVHNLSWYAYFQNKGVDNTFRNNIGAFARDGLIGRGGLGKGWEANHFDVRRNLYVTDNEVALRSRWAPGERPPVLQGNMYHTLAPDAELTFAGKTFAEWQATGQDQGSLILDPGFRDPANSDFTLRPDSPAIGQLGFVPFDEEIRKVGLYGDPEWVATPSRYTRREPAPVWTADDLARLIAFDLDFENMPVGYRPNQFRLSSSGEATFAVTDEAALSGTKSYRCVDCKGLAKSYNPYIHIAPKGMDQGQVAFAFAAMLHAETPAPFYVEFRGAGSTSQVGPSIQFSTDGRIVANDQEVLVAPPGTWTEIKITLQLGADAPKTYELVLHHAGETKRLTLPYKHDSFTDVRWIGFSASADMDGVFYLDDMKLAF
jgi:hypothetical protein